MLVGLKGMPGWSALRSSTWANTLRPEAESRLIVTVVVPRQARSRRRVGEDSCRAASIHAQLGLEFAQEGRALGHGALYVDEEDGESKLKQGIGTRSLNSNLPPRPMNSLSLGCLTRATLRHLESSLVLVSERRNARERSRPSPGRPTFDRPVRHDELLPFEERLGGAAEKCFQRIDATSHALVRAVAAKAAFTVRRAPEYVAGASRPLHPRHRFPCTRRRRQRSRRFGGTAGASMAACAFGTASPGKVRITPVPLSSTVPNAPMQALVRTARQEQDTANF